MTKAKRNAWLINQIANQQRWIDKCEAGGVSYADPKWGQRIADEDRNELKRLESELAKGTR